MDTVIKYHSELSSQQKFSFNKKFYPAGDADKIKLWLRSTDLGNFVKDRSGRNHTASLYGDPTLVNGTLDLGIHTYGVKSIARRMNRPTSDFQNLEWMAVPDTADLRSAGLTVGISIFIRFRLHSLSDQNGRAPTIFEKIEDSTPNDAYMLQAKSDGRLVFIFKKGGVTYSKESATPTITAGAVYDVWAVFDEADNSIHIYLDGAELTLEPFTGGVNWQTNTTNYDLQIFRRGPDEEEGFVYGDFYDLKFYPEYVVSDLDVSRHYINKWTISNIPFGQVMITNYWATFGAGGGIIPGVCSFTQVSFTPDSYTICTGATGVCSFSPVSFSPLTFNLCTTGGGTGGTPGDGFDDIGYDTAQFD